MTFDPFEQGDTFDPSTISWVLDDAALDRTLDLIDQCSEVVIDLETTGLDEQNGYDRKKGTRYPPRIAMAALTLPFDERPGEPVNIVVPGSHPDGPWANDWVRVMTALARAIEEAGHPVTNANVKFDMRWLYRFSGVDLAPLLAWDTTVSSHLLDENSSTKLKERAPDTFGIDRWDDHDLSTPGAAERVPFFDLGVYAARDTYWTWRLAEAHRAAMGVGEWGEEPPVTREDVENYRIGRHAVWCAMPMVATLTQVEQHGIGLDVPRVRTEVAEQDGRAQEKYEALTEMYRVPGEPNFAPNAKFFKAWTDAAIDAGDLRVAALTPTGKPQWSKAVLRKQAREGSPAAEVLLDWRDATKRLEFLRSWLDYVGPDGRIHAGYNVARVVTGRLSSSAPNLQQVSKALKPMFIPTPGYSLVELDYSQIEVRLAAFVAQCAPLIDVYAQGRDVYIEQAAEVAGIPVEDVTGEQRQRAKAVVLGYLYGMGEDGFRDYADATFGIEVTAEEAAISRAAFFRRWSGMASWHNHQIRSAVETGQVVSPLGRVRRLPGIHDANPATAGRAERQAINSPVQSMASDVMQIAAASVAGTLPGFDAIEGVRIVATVHDSIIVEVPRTDEVRATARVMRRMVDVPEVLERAFGVRLPVPLPVEAEIGDRWGETRITIT